MFCFFLWPEKRGLEVAGCIVVDPYFLNSRFAFSYSGKYQRPDCEVAGAAKQVHSASASPSGTPT